MTSSIWSIQPPLIFPPSAGVEYLSLSTLSLYPTYRITKNLGGTFIRWTAVLAKVSWQNLEPIFAKNCYCANLYCCKCRNIEQIIKLSCRSVRGAVNRPKLSNLIKWLESRFAFYLKVHPSKLHLNSLSPRWTFLTCAIRSLLVVARYSQPRRRFKKIV